MELGFGGANSAGMGPVLGGAVAIPGLPAAPAVTAGRQGWSEERLGRTVAAALAHFRSQLARDNKLRDMFFKRIDEDSDVVKTNFDYAYVSVLLAVLYANAPTIQVEPRENSGGSAEYFAPLMQAGILAEPTLAAAQRSYSDAIEAVLTYTYECADSDAHVSQFLQESIITGLGVLKHSFDADGEIDRTDCLQRHETYFDPDARFELRQCRFVCHSAVMPLDAARLFFAAKRQALYSIWEAQQGQQAQSMPTGLQGGMPGAPGAGAVQSMPAGNVFNLDIKWDPGELQANERTPDAVADESGMGIAASAERGPEKEYVRYYEIWVQENGERWIYYRTVDKSIDFRMPWPFTLKRSEFPFTLFSVNKRGQNLNDAFSELSVVEALRKVYQRASEFFRRLLERAIGKTLLYDKEAIGPQIETIKKGGELVMVAVDGLANKDPKRLFSLINFNEGDPVVLEYLGELKRSIDEILGNDELVRGADDQRAMTATEAKVRDDGSRVRLGRRKSLFDGALADMSWKRAIIARQKLSPDLVMKIAGPAAALMWSVHSAEADDFLMEYQISVAAGSTAQRHKEEQVSNYDQIINRMNSINGQRMQMQRPPVFDTVEASKAQLAVMERNVERFVIKPNEMGPPAMQQQPMQAGQGQPVQQNTGAGLQPAAVQVPGTGAVQGQHA